MSITSIKVSQLGIFPDALVASDYFPINKNGTTTTYRSTLSQLQTLICTGSFSGSFTGSLLGTSSWATNSLTASSVTASNVIGTVTSASYALSASYVSGSGGTIGGSEQQIIFRYGQPEHN